MWRSTPLATALAAALALAALAACGGDPLPPTPTATVTPTAPATSTPSPTVAVTATPSPTATLAATPALTSGAEPCDLIVVENRYGCRGVISPSPTPTPEPIPCESFDCIRENLCRGVECMEAKPDPKTCQSYDCIETVPNAFERRIFEPGEHIDWEEGVFFLQVETGRTEAYRVEGAGEGQGYAPGGEWVEARRYFSDWRLLLHRESGQAWRWAEGAQGRLVAFLKGHLDLDYPTCVTHFEPRLPIGQPGWRGVVCGESAGSESAQEETICQGRLSPDGRYVAQQWGEPIIDKRHRPHPPTLYSSSSVVIADAETCEPLFRVRSAYAYGGGMWEGQWLSNSEGFVLGVEDGYAIARVHPGPELVYLPPVPLGAWSLGPVPAPTGDGRYLAYDFTGVYDIHRDQWILTGFSGHWGLFSWGETHKEMRYELGYWGEGGLSWSLSAPRIEFPPFEEVSFRVARTSSCLKLREEPSLEGAVLDCLRDGTRVVLVVPPRDRGERSCGFGYGSSSCLPAIRESPGDNAVLDWVYVRSEAGLEGWTAFSRIEGNGTYYESYLDHD